jgi:hypothetical protein
MFLCIIRQRFQILAINQFLKVLDFPILIIQLKSIAIKPEVVIGARQDVMTTFYLF